MSTIEPNEEHLSAYLDGELDGDALDRVEHHLQSDDEFRRCYEDFRALRDSIQRLPRHTLGPEFSQRLLESIEANAAARPAPAEVAQAADQTTPPGAGRGWLPWAIGAVAATLLFALVIPGLLPGPINNVAMQSASEVQPSVAADDESSLGKSPAQESTTMAETPAPVNQTFDTPTRDTYAPRLDAPESPRGAVVEELFADEIREQDQTAATTPPDEQPAEQFLLKSIKAKDDLGVVAGESQRAQSRTRRSGSDPVRAAEPTQPSRRFLSYRKLDPSTDEFEKLSEVRDDGAGSATPSYFVTLNDLSEQRLIEVLESRQLPLSADNLAGRKLAEGQVAEKKNEELEASPSQLRLDDSSSLADLEAEKRVGAARQSLVRRVRSNDDRDSGRRLERSRNLATRYVVVDATVDEAADLLRALDSLVSAEGIKLVPMSANANVTNRVLGIDSFREEDRFSDLKSLSPSSATSQPLDAETEPARTLGRGESANSPAGDARVVDAADDERAEPTAANVAAKQRREVSRSRMEVQPSIDLDQTAGLAARGGDTSVETVRMVFAFDTVPLDGTALPAANAQRSGRDE